MKLDAVCRACHAPIVWAVWSKTGRPVAFDRDPRRDGNVILQPGRPPVAKLVIDPGDLPLYVAHDATCAAKQPGKVA